jgi:Tfp pilus assembly protein PilF
MAAEHFTKAVTCSDGHKASPYLAIASLYVQKNDRQKYEELLSKALEIDPDSDQLSRNCGLVRTAALARISTARPNGLNLL